MVNFGGAKQGRLRMTITIDPISLATLVLVFVTAASEFMRVGRLGSGVDRLEADVKDLKCGQQRILELLNQHIGYRQGLNNAVP